MDLAAVRPSPAYVPRGSARWPLRLATTGIVVAGAAVGLQTAAHLVNSFVLDGRHPALDAATDGNAFAWAASLGTLAAAGAALAVGLAFPRHRLRGACLVVLVTFLAIDDMLDLHDVLATGVAHDLPGRLSGVGAWTMPLVYLPVLAIVFLLLVRSAWDAPFPATRPLWLGLGFLAAAVAIRVAAGALKFDGDVVPGDIRTLGVAIHQGAELGGWILVATGLVAFAAVREPATASRPSGGGRPSP